MGMSTFGLMILLCLLSVCTLVNSASILENSNDLWKNWLLNENEEIPSQQSSPLSRRITPKSVFVAPAFSRCSEGYRLDSMGNCVEIVRLDEAAQWGAVLERLKQMSAQQLGFIKRQSQSQRNDTTTINNGHSGGEKINHPKVSSEDTDNRGPLQLSIPFNSRNSSDTQLLQQYDPPSTITTASATEKYPKYMSTTSRPTTIQTTTVSYEGAISQNTHFVDYVTEETTESQDLTTFAGIDYQEDTESNQYSTESVNTEVTVTDSSTTEDTLTESVPNVASHFADFDKINDATEITTQVIRRRPNYNSVLPLKGVINANANVEQIPISSGSSHSSHSSSSSTGGLANFKPFSSYTAGKPDVNNFTNNVNTAKTAPLHSIANNFNKNDHLDEESTSVPSDLFQKLPPSERAKPKCDSTNKYDCLLQINIFPTHKPLFVFNRKPPQLSSASSSATFVRFPEPSQKGYVRFPPQKAAAEYDDVALAESNPGYRYWDRRYPTSWWSTAWKSKPQFIQIVPESSAGAVYGAGDMNYIRSHPHFQTQTEWYTK